MRKGIELPCLFVPDDQVPLFDMELPYTSEPRPVMFYNISAISPYIDTDGNNYTEIMCNGTEYICIHDYETVKRLIDDNH